MRTSWNDQEDEALQGLPLRAQIIYLRGIRRYMDYVTAISGGAARRISLTMLAEVSQELFNRQIQPKASKDAIRASIEQLKRAGLIQRIDHPDFLIFYLPKADVDKSQQNNHPISTPQAASSQHSSPKPPSLDYQPVQQSLSTPQTKPANYPTHQESNNPVLKTGGQPDSQPPFQAIIDLYHHYLPTLPKVYKLSSQRRHYIKALWRDELDDLDCWRNYYQHINKSDFLMGRKAGRDGVPFLASFDFIIHPVKFIKIAEEQYHGQKIQTGR